MHLLLDIDGVLQVERPDLEATLVNEFGWVGDHAAFRQRLFSDPHYHDALRGKHDFSDVLERLLVEHGGITPEQYLQRWVSDFVLNYELLDSLEGLHCDRVCLASNQERWRGSAIAVVYRNYSFITNAYFSYEIGFRKPDPEFFRHVLDSLAVEPDELVFVDDLVENVKVAASLGIRTVRYETNLQFCTALEKLGCL